MENNTVPATGKRIALITGASSGMGREFVLALNRQEKFGLFVNSWGRKNLTKV